MQKIILFLIFANVKICFGIGENSVEIEFQNIDNIYQNIVKSELHHEINKFINMIELKKEEIVLDQQKIKVIERELLRYPKESKNNDKKIVRIQYNEIYDTDYLAKEEKKLFELKQKDLNVKIKLKNKEKEKYISMLESVAHKLESFNKQVCE